jgi:hypothetical protein
VSDDVVGAIVQQTKGTSAAFIKELMRHSAQFEFEIDGNDVLHHRSVHGALEEMLLVGGSLNAKLLGAEAADIVGGSGTSSSDTSTFVITTRLHSGHEI